VSVGKLQLPVPLPTFLTHDAAGEQVVLVTLSADDGRTNAETIHDANTSVTRAQTCCSQQHPIIGPD